MQSPVLKDELGFKTAPVQGALEARTAYGNKHVLSGVTRGCKMVRNGEVCVRYLLIS